MMVLDGSFPVCYRLQHVRLQVPFAVINVLATLFPSGGLGWMS